MTAHSPALNTGTGTNSHMPSYCGGGGPGFGWWPLKEQGFGYPGSDSFGVLETENHKVLYCGFDA